MNQDVCGFFQAFSRLEYKVLKEKCRGTKPSSGLSYDGARTSGHTLCPAPLARRHLSFPSDNSFPEASYLQKVMENKPLLEELLPF